ncbi:hypothetical protein [Listeria seeligeri]|uniref:hypothetical protein n=1 Tax=Listeria seeligeri TaxID=1640 RepID=UPI0016274AC2|nr:hypothetical protein [Listeria seeligeri]EFU7331890.1 hypothetical protein [Listeria monocytogenes]MBC1479240.1 hypothetical protein [Listeria seeligeri]MBC1929579.1 hypothetical protein [Listeria seeligeri]MBC6113387.1 hypothetical protein [Listeria seeligeri]MBC6159490.1 hypothetical protein [Listeria seeligeri]
MNNVGDENEKDERQMIEDSKMNFKDFIDCIVFFIIFIGILVYMISGFSKILFVSDEKMEQIVPKYISIEIGDNYELKEWEYENGFLRRVEISYIAVNKKTNEKLEVIHDVVRYSDMEDTIAKEKTRKRLEKKLE